MIFPDLKNKKFGYANLNLEAKLWLAAAGQKGDKNPLLDPVICNTMVSSVHKKYDIDFSYGGWMEDRSTLWKDSYLEEWKSFIHLGIDLNVPTGTRVAASFDAQVVKIDDDYPEDGGWGPRVIVKHATKPIYLIYAHLDRNLECKVGDILKTGRVFAKVGHAPYNGNWFPHLHVQTISAEYYEKLEKKGLWKELDGYGSPNDTPEDARNFPDPMRYISLI